MLGTQRLFDARTVLVFGEITAQLAEQVSAQSGKPIQVFVSSPGGHVESGDTIHDVIRFVEPEVRSWVAAGSRARAH